MMFIANTILRGGAQFEPDATHGWPRASIGKMAVWCFNNWTKAGGNPAALKKREPYPYAVPYDRIVRWLDGSRRCMGSVWKTPRDTYILACSDADDGITLASVMDLGVAPL